MSTSNFQLRHDGLALYKKYQDTVKTEDELLKREIDYADEITYNAKIIVQKYKCFKNAYLYVRQSTNI